MAFWLCKYTSFFLNIPLFLSLSLIFVLYRFDGQLTICEGFGKKYRSSRAPEEKADSKLIHTQSKMGNCPSQKKHWSIKGRLQSNINFPKVLLNFLRAKVPENIVGEFMEDACEVKIEEFCETLGLRRL